jgi:hypothetical protein
MLARRQCAPPTRPITRHLLPHPAPSPFAFSPTSLDLIPFRSYNTATSAFPSIQHPHSIHTTKRLSRHSTLCVPTTASPTRHYLRNHPLASALLLANFRPSSAPPTHSAHTSHNRSSSITKTKNPSPQPCLTNTTTACLTTLLFRRMRRTILTATMVAAGGARESPRRMRTGSSRRNATSRRSHRSRLLIRSTYSVWRLRRASNLTMMSFSVPSTS